jgi:hypothetical protein
MTLSAPLRCSDVAEGFGEPVAGTVDQRDRWLLVEDRGAWGEKAVRDVLGADLESAAKDRGVRLLLVRRREGDPAADAVRRAFLVDTVRAEMAVRTITELTQLAPLLDASRAEFGAPLSDPIVLVCTNGKRDPCCALRGRALIGSLASDHGERTWECSHLGGHRFAANLVCLPHGIVYGRVPPADGPRLVDLYLAGRLDPALLRGRSAWPAPAQVAERVVREERGLDGVDDLALDGVEIDGEAAAVRIGLPGGTRVTVDLAAERHDPPRQISCRADELEAPLHWAVRSVREEAAAPRTA